MFEFDRSHVVRRDDDSLADPGHPPELGGECGGEPDAAMRGRMAWHHAKMHGDAGPGDPLHERHRRAGIDIGAMETLAADDAENALGRRMSWNPCRDRRTDDKAVVIIDRHALVGDRGDEEQRPLELWRIGLGFARRRAGLVGLRRRRFLCSNMARSRDTPRLSRRRRSRCALAAPKEKALRHGGRK